MRHTASPRRQGRELPAIVIVCVMLTGGMLIARSTERTQSGTLNDQPINTSLSQAGAAAADSNDANEWPSMILVYQSGDTIARLHYQDANHWSKQVIESQRDPALVGIVTAFIDTTYSEAIPNTIDAETGKTVVHREELTDGVAVPERWLRPNFAQILEEKHFVVSAGASPNDVIYSQVWTVPCPPLPLGATEQPTIPQPDECETGKTYQEVETYVFRTDITPPLAVKGQTQVGGQIMWQAEVLEIDFPASSVEVTSP